MQSCIAFQNILIRRCSDSWYRSRTSSNVLRIASTPSLMQSCIAFQNILIRRCSNSWDRSQTSSNVFRIASTLSLMQSCIAFQNILIRRCRNSWNWGQTSNNRSLNWVTLSDVHRVSCQRCSNTTKRNKTLQNKRDVQIHSTKKTPKTTVWFFPTHREADFLKNFAQISTKTKSTYNINKRRILT